MPRSFVLSYVEDKMMRVNSGKAPGPVITIARDYGCPGVPVANKVAELLATALAEWKVIDKEIINNAAKELSLSPDTAERISRNGPRGFFHYFIGAFAQQQNPSDAVIKLAIANAIRAFSLAGNVVILGRGGVVITRDVKLSLHVKLYARLAYRKVRVMEMDHLASEREALEKISVVDRERVYLRDYFAGEELKDDIFDVQFNCATLTEKEIVEGIVALAKDKFGFPP